MKLLSASAALLTLALTACIPTTQAPQTSNALPSSTVPIPDPKGMTAADISSFKGTVSATAEVPTNTSAVSGSILLILFKKDKTALVTGQVTNLSGAPTAQHIHAPALTGENAPVFKPLDSSLSNINAYKISGSFKLTDAEIADLKAGKFYFNIHTTAHPGGEGRAQLQGTPE